MVWQRVAVSEAQGGAGPPPTGQGWTTCGLWLTIEGRGRPRVFLELHSTRDVEGQEFF
jgi:hypothetical protein